MAFKRIQPAGIQIFKVANVRWYPEASSAGFVLGDFVKLATGKVAIAAAAGNTLAASTLLGMALGNASGTSTGTPTVPVYVFDADTVIRLPVVAGTGATSTALAQVGAAYGIRHTTTTDACGVDGWAVDIAETSAVYGQVESIPTNPNGLGDSYPIATEFGTVDFRINLNKVQGAGVTP